MIRAPDPRWSRSYVPVRISSDYLPSCSLWISGYGLDAHELESESMYAIQDPVQMRLVDYFSRDDRLSFIGPYVHPFEGRGETLADLRPHHYSVSVAPRGSLFTVGLHLMLLYNKICKNLRASPTTISHPGDLQPVSTAPAAPFSTLRLRLRLSAVSKSVGTVPTVRETSLSLWSFASRAWASPFEQELTAESDRRA